MIKEPMKPENDFDEINDGENEAVEVKKTEKQIAREKAKADYWKRAEEGGYDRADDDNENQYGFNDEDKYVGYGWEANKENFKKAAEEGKWVDNYDPTNPENYEDKDEPKPEEPKPEQPKPEEPKPEEPKPEQPKPEEPKPEPKPEVPRLPVQCIETFKQEYKTEKSKGGVWGWFKERFKGAATVGIWEINQAEKFRRRSKTESLKLTEEAKNVDQLENLDYRSAYEEAAKMQEMAKQSGDNSRDAFEKFSFAITAEKINSNTKEIERIMQESVLRLQESMEKGIFQGYKTETGRSVINAENMEKFQERLREQLVALQSGTKAERGGAVPINEKALLNIVRGLDENYWHRYVYGGVEAAVEGIIAYGVLGAGAAAEKAGEAFYTMKKGDTLWGIAKANLGAHATDAQIMKGAGILAKANNVGVNVWGLAGSLPDTLMPIGTKVSLGALKAAIAGGAI